MLKQTVTTKLAICLMLVLIADGLFYRQAVGWTAGLYASLLLLALVGLNQHLLQTRASKIIAFCTVTLIMTLVESPQTLAVGLISLGMMTLLILQKRKNLSSALLWLSDIRSFLAQGIRQWYQDFHKIKRITKNKPCDKLKLNYAILPVSLTLLFIFLFAQANPIIAKAFTGIDWLFLIRLMSIWRWLFWFLTAVLIWALLRPRFSLAMATEAGTGLNLERWLNQQTLVLSLLLFNAVFALQNSLDIVFLWSGKALPEGLSYAEYAHAGAYPLFVTSIITAVYVLITFGEHQQKYQTSLAKKLTFVWLGQNIFLEVSAIDRLLHYIDVYSLTYLRIAALIGMVLTALGLLLIIARIYANHRNIWLINANAIVIAVTLYLSCFVNMDKIIADYNVRHALEVTGTGTAIDLAYLRSLGAESLPALRWFQANAKYSSARQNIRAEDTKADLENRLAGNATNWRAWTWRTQRQLAINAIPAQAVPIGNSGWQY